jgi:hypothetical protein
LKKLKPIRNNMPLVNPQFKLTSVKTFQGGEGYGLNADLWLNGRKVCFVRDAGNGGCFDYDMYGNTPEAVRENRRILQEIEEYAKTLPEREYDAELGGGTYQPDLESLINDLFAEVEKKKDDKKMIKKMENHIIIGVPNGNSYRSAKLQQPLRSYPLNVLQNLVNQMKPRLQRGEVFLNTNFPEGINSNR